MCHWFSLNIKKKNLSICTKWALLFWRRSLYFLSKGKTDEVQLLSPDPSDIIKIQPRIQVVPVRFNQAVQTCLSLLSRVVRISDPGSDSRKYLFSSAMTTGTCLGSWITLFITTQWIVKGANIPAGLDLLIHVIVFHTHCMICDCSGRTWLLW